MARQYTPEELSQWGIEALKQNYKKMMDNINDPSFDFESMDFALKNSVTGEETIPRDKKEWYVTEAASAADKIAQWERWANQQNSTAAPEPAYVQPQPYAVNQQSAPTGAPSMQPNYGSQANYGAPAQNAFASLGMRMGRGGNAELSPIVDRANEVMRNWEHYGSRWFVVPLDRRHQRFADLDLVYSYICVLSIEVDPQSGVRTVYVHPIAIEQSGDINAAVDALPVFRQGVNNITGGYLAHVTDRPKRAFFRMAESFMHEKFPDTAPRQGGVSGVAFNFAQAEWQLMKPAVSNAAPGSYEFSTFVDQLNLARDACAVRWAAITGTEFRLVDAMGEGFEANIALTPFGNTRIGGQQKRTDFRVTFVSKRQNQSRQGYMAANDVKASGQDNFNITVVGYVDFYTMCELDDSKNVLWYQPIVVITGIECNPGTVGANILALGLMSEYTQSYAWLNLIGIPMVRTPLHDYSAMMAYIKKQNGKVDQFAGYDFSNIEHLRSFLRTVCPAIAVTRLQVPVLNNPNPALSMFVQSALKPSMPMSNDETSMRNYEKAMQEWDAAGRAVARAANTLTNGALVGNNPLAAGTWKLFTDDTGYKANGTFAAGQGGANISTDQLDLTALLTIITTVNDEATRQFVHDEEGRQTPNTVELYKRSMRSANTGNVNTLFGSLNAAMKNGLTFDGIEYVLWVDFKVAMEQLRGALVTANVVLDKKGMVNYSKQPTFGNNLLGNYLNAGTIGTTQYVTGVRDSTNMFNSGLVTPLL